ncbi:TetR/AcrR family transcriptional regulator [Planobispora siamensis]|uniref:HTH-type transcriptional regulator PksA n=1 Tax=Planobispora siamensis TaxID=936338 RepID=A0A8J3WN82_9ACTN|nr:TetR/AcrR family transcriptional regulator [Planobispora siamensis]GIH95510.1 HTH-type transcriptional regulator PksA [Planobispora siamensis]
MPKIVDHDERRRHITEAVLRIAGRHGPDRATLRDIAVEAGISLGAVQHYFRSKEELLRHVVGHLGEQVTARIMTRVGDLGDVSALSFLEAMAVEILPLDARRRAERRVAQAFGVRAPDLPELIEPLREGYDWVRDHVAELIRQAQGTGELRPELDAECESIALLAMIDGLSSDILIGVRDPGRAVEIVRYHLNRLAAR